MASNPLARGRRSPGIYISHVRRHGAGGMMNNLTNMVRIVGIA